MKIPPINPLQSFASVHGEHAEDTPSPGPDRAPQEKPSRLLRNLAQMRRSDASDGGSWCDTDVLPSGHAMKLGQIDRCLSGAHAVVTLLHATECDRSHDDGRSELGDDLCIGLLFAARELVSGARESLSELHAFWADTSAHR